MGAQDIKAQDTGPSLEFTHSGWMAEVCSVRASGLDR
jgi:hypothetical protein